MQESGGWCPAIDNKFNRAQKEQEEAEAAAAAAAQAEKDREEEALDNWEEMDVEAVKLPGTQSAEEEVCKALSGNLSKNQELSAWKHLAKVVFCVLFMFCVCSKSFAP